MNNAVAQQNHSPFIDKGILDLRNKDLTTETYALEGDWQFNWRQLISPRDTTTAQGYFKIPSLWNGKTFNGQELSPNGFATYRLTVLLPAKRPSLALEIPDSYSASKLFINGKLFYAAGDVDSSEEKSSPHWITKTIPLEIVPDTLQLTYQVANFWHSKGGTNDAISLGNKETFLLERRRSEAFDLLLTGCLFMGGLFFFGLYFFGKHDRAILFFSLFCMLYSYRIIGTDMYALHNIFPSLSWFLTTRLEYITLYLSIGFFAQYTIALYPKDVHRYALKSMTWFCFAFAAIVIIFPPSVFTRLINIFLVAMFIYIGYAFYVYILAAKRKRLGAKYALMSTAVMLLVFLFINLHYFGFTPPLKGLMFVGYIAFFFLQSLILSYRFATTLKLAKQQAEEGLIAKSEFLSTMSHEIRTPLNSVIGTAHIMLKNEPRADQKQQLDILLFSANNLLSLVNDILDFNKIEANMIRFENIPFDLRDTVNKLMGALGNTANEKQVDLVTEIDKNIPDTVIGDPTRLSQVLMNLVHNAIKFTNEGSVKLSLQKLTEENNSIHIQFKVTDTGIGIAAEKQNLIFEQFTQADSSTSRSFGGTGLGLAITKKILDQQGSILKLQSTPGVGSVFQFNLSFEKNALPSTTPVVETKTNVASASLRGKTVLLVEDNALNIFVAKSFLEQWGAKVVVAENGKIATEKIDPALQDIVLIDMHMPVMDGYEAVSIIRERGIQTPIIALTASISRESETRVLKVGANALIVKPFDPDKLLSTLLRFLPE
jgi:signal transduction histidine kinase